MLVFMVFTRPTWACFRCCRLWGFRSSFDSFCRLSWSTMSVVGFDVGTMNCHVGVARGGGVDVVMNELSDRNSPAVVGFHSNGRVAGKAAEQKLRSNFKGTIFDFKPLLGLLPTSRRLAYEKSLYDYDIVDIPAEGGCSNSIGIRVNYCDQERVFRLEQISACLLQYLGEIAKNASNSNVSDCVISVPGFFNELQRRALLDAASIAGLKCLQIMNDTSAAALSYGFFKSDLPAETEPPRHVAFIDVGHMATQVAIVAFNRGKMKVVGYAFNDYLGGRDITLTLFEHFADDIKKRYKVDVRDSSHFGLVKAKWRLMQECERVKKVTGSITLDVPFSIECFFEEIDVKGKTTRKELEEMLEKKGFYDRLVDVFNAAVERSGVKMTDLASVEMVGGSSRVPSIKELVEKTFGQAPSFTLNADEAVTRGCVLQGCIRSPLFKVREFEVLEYQPYSISMEYRFLDPSLPAEVKTVEVFPVGHGVPNNRLITFHKRAPISLDAFYTKDQEELNKNCPSLGRFEVHSFPDPPSEEIQETKIRAKTRVNHNGLFEMKQVRLEEKYIVSIAEKTEPAAAGASDASGAAAPPAAADGSTAPPAQGEGQAAADAPGAPAAMDAGSSAAAQGVEKMEVDEQAPANTAADEANAGSANVNAPPPKKTKLKTAMTDLQVDSMFNIGLSVSTVEKFIVEEQAMVQHEVEERSRLEAKNALEEYVYDMREKMSEGGWLFPFVAEQQRSEFLGRLTDMEDWLYGDGERVDRQTYADRLEQLRRFGDQVEFRRRESEFRPGAFNRFNEAYNRFGKVLEAARSKTGAEAAKYEHLDKEDCEKMQKALEEAYRFFCKAENELRSLEKFQDPPITSQQVDEHRQALENICTPIANKPKPKEEPPPDTKSAKKDKKQSAKEPEKESEKKEPASASSSAGQEVNGPQENGAANEAAGAKPTVDMELGVD